MIRLEEQLKPVSVAVFVDAFLLKGFPGLEGI